MKITFDDEVKASLVALTEKNDADFVLDFDHTLSRKSVIKGCSGTTRYRIVAVNKGSVPEIFDGQISSNFVPIFFQKWGDIYLDPDMKIRKNGALIEIMGAGGVIAKNMEIVDFRENIAQPVMENFDC